MTNHYNFTSELNIRRINKILEICSKHPADAFELADAINITYDAMRGFMRYLLQEKKVHIKEYRLRNRRWIRYYFIGNKKSANIEDYIKCSENQTQARRERYERERKPNKVVYKPKKLQPDIHSAWLFNPK